MNERKKEFIKALAKWFARGAEMSIRLEMGDEEAKQWAELRSLTPLFGYQSEEEIEEILMDFLG